MNQPDPFQQALHHHHAGQWAEARAAYERCLALNPHHGNALTNLGSVCRQLGDIPAARHYLERAIEVVPDDPGAHYNLGNLHRSQGDLTAAIARYRASLACAKTPRDTAQAAYNLALSLTDQGQPDAALDAYEQTLSAQPTHLDARLNRAVLHASRGQLGAALADYQTLIQRHPADARILNNLANLYQDMGRIDEALATLDAAITLQPELPNPRSNRLMALQYQPGLGAADLLKAAKDWGQWATTRACQLLGAEPTRRFTRIDPERSLRIGYVSADLCMHPVGLFLHDIIAAHDPAQVTPLLYSNGSSRDHITTRLSESAQRKGGGLRDITALDDLTLARQIEADQIDILIDLSGHTGKSRLAVFALRPAPVQISWLGYFATTGLPAIDFVLLDPHHAPPGTEAQFTERIIHLPHNRFCYSPVAFAPAVSPVPTFKNGYVTFGSFNNTAKLNDQVLATWAEILRQVPDSRLILKWRTFADPAYRSRIESFFSTRGIAPERLDLRPASVHRDLLEQYADLDIALDPFPFSGGHTSCEALWMGVPVVTLPQERIVSRQTWSFLNNLGLTELAAQNIDDYIRIAVTLANTPQRLKTLRESLRERMRTSPLCDVPGFTRQFETACRQVWNTLRHETALAWAKEGIRRRETDAPISERIACYREAWRLAPEEAQYAANLASALSADGQYAEAAKLAQQATEQAPSRFEPWFNLGVALAGLGQDIEAAQAYTRAAENLPAHSPQNPDQSQRILAWRAAGDAWSRGRHALKAFQAYQAALRASGPAPTPERAALLGAAGEMLEQLYQFTPAEQAYREALAITPQDAGLLTNLGNALRAQGRHDAARQCYEQVLTLRPDLAGAYSNLGTVWQSLGDNDRAIDYHRQALTLDPGIVAIWSNLSAALTYSLQQGPHDVRQALSEFDEKVARPLRDPRPHPNPPEPHPFTSRRLKIGYVSPDFRKHAVAYFALPLLSHHDKTQVEVFCYHNHLQNDAWTAQFKALADHWRVAVALSDAQLAEQIRADGIDILIDLAGHTENNRLLTFARKPAPVQATWMGYVTTTGMQAMDWRITHADADPEGSDADYTEKLVRLPGTMWCWQPVPEMPAVAPAPTFTKGHITFGSFNRFSKNGTAVLTAWADILNRVKDARLLLCVPEGEIRQQMLAGFAERGVEPGRIHCFDKLDHASFWQRHGEVDIALDPFPFGGGTTTCETLWLGVPLITCTGEGGDFAPRFASRMGKAFLTNIGHPELVAGNIAEYIDKAVALAHDRERLSQLRQSLRPAMATAPLTDAKRFAREMEAAYRDMWAQWCAGQKFARASESFQRGNALRAQGEHAAAAHCYQSALELRPDLVVAYNNLGNALRDLGQFTEAAAALQHAIELQPDYAAAHNNLGTALFELERIEDAAGSFSEAIRLQPDFAIAYKNLGDAHKEMGRFPESVACYRQALSLGLHNAEALNNLGIALRELGKYEEAMTCYRQAIDLEPGLAAPWCNLGLACHDIGRLAEAEAHLRHAMALKSGFVIAQANLGSLLKDLGRYDEAIACFEQVLAVDPDYVEAHNNLQFALHLQQTCPQRTLAAASSYGAWANRRAQPYSAWNNIPDPGRSLTIGWVSGDLRIHPVGYFLESVLQQLKQQHTGLHHVAYASYFLKDELTARLQACCCAWHEVMGWSDQRLVQQIHADQIDILIDLAGHTAHNRLPVFAWKPAPVQVTWLGYFATTGVKEIDWLMADPYTLPESEEPYFTEKIWRLPETRLCFTPPTEDIPVNQLPALSNGYITFGCFNNLAKMNDEVVATWATILKALPDSRLFLKTKQLADAAVRKHTLTRFAVQGIDPQRITLEGPTSRADYLAAYQCIDIALDPFPYPGGTTTVEALWMGVPVLTLAGERFLSRQGVGLLMNVGLPEWIAESREDYVRRANLHASKLEALAQLRQDLRPQLLASPVADAARFADHFAIALRGMWQTWCRQASTN